MIEDNKKKRIKKKIVLESIIVFFIAITPFLFKVYDYLPDSNPEETINFLGITIGSNGFNNVSAYVWFLTGKIIPLYLLVFWFLTSKDWWYHILLIPILMYAFQLFELLYSEDDKIDTENIWWLLPICMVIVPVVYFIRIKLYDKYVHGIDLEAMDAELESLKPFNKGSNDTETNIEQTEDETIEPEQSIGYQSFSEYLNSTFSTNNIERKFKSFQNNLKGWLHLKS
jgi:hypothetical protein